VSGRAGKPVAGAGDVKRLLATPTRRLTEDEKAARVDFYADSNVHAVAVEPADYARGRSTGKRFRD